MSGQEFAKHAGTTADRVLRHLKAWQAAADDGVVPSASELRPGKEIDLDADKLPLVERYYDASKAGGYNGGKDRMPTATTLAEAFEKAPNEVIERAMTKVSSGKAAGIVQAGLSRPGIERTLADDPEKAASVTRASGKIREHQEHKVRNAKPRGGTGGISGAASSVGFLTEVFGNLHGAKRRLSDAYESARDYDLSDDQREAVEEGLEELVQIVDWFRSYLNSGDQSFEDELSKLLASD